MRFGGAGLARGLTRTTSPARLCVEVPPVQHHRSPFDRTRDERLFTGIVAVLVFLLGPRSLHIIAIVLHLDGPPVHSPSQESR